MNKLRTLRRDRGLTQSELGKALGVSPSTIGMYEQGRREPDKDALLAIANFFNVSTDYLLGNDTPAPSYYSDSAVAEMAEELKNNPGIKMLFDASRNASQKDLEIAANLLKQLKGDDE